MEHQRSVCNQWHLKSRSGRGCRNSNRNGSFQLKLLLILGHGSGRGGRDGNGSSRRGVGLSCSEGLSAHVRVVHREVLLREPSARQRGTGPGPSSR